MTSLNTVEEPRLIRARRDGMIVVMNTAKIGILVRLSI